jgi:hypothetical protein
MNQSIRESIRSRHLDTCPPLIEVDIHPSILFRSRLGFSVRESPATEVGHGP